MLAIVVVLFAFMCFYVLAPWQLGKNSRTEHRNSLIESAMNEDAVPGEQLLGTTGLAPDDEWREVTLTGRYLPEAQVLLRLRSVEEQPSFEALVPFALDNGTTFLVNRGYVRPVNGTEPPPIDPPPSGEVTLDGRLRMDEGSAEGKGPIEAQGVRQVYFIDSAEIGTAVGVPMLPGWLQLLDDQPGGLGVIPMPNLDAGPYLSYGLQWLAFGIMAPIGLAYFVRAELKERRKRRGREEAAAPAPAAASAENVTATGQTESDPAPSPVATATDADIPVPLGPLAKRRQRRDAATEVSAREAKLNDRYGGRR